MRGMYVHSLGDLLRHAQLERQLAIDTAGKQNLRRNWDVVRGWTVDARYSSTATKQTATELFFSASDLKTGVLTWLKLHW